VHDAWAAQGRPWKIEDIIRQAGEHSKSTGLLDMDAETLMLDTEMPQRINKELTRLGFDRFQMWRGMSRFLRA